jgi:hypothetical protein
MQVSNPILFILNHKSSILPIHYQNGQKTKKTWNRLNEALPEIRQAMKFNTFKQYLSVIIAVTSELGDVIEEKNAVRQTLSNSSIVSQTELDKVRQGLDDPPKRLLGWNVRKAKDGYYRCYRKINNRVHSVYLGKTIDVQKAQQRIKEKERLLKLDKG